MMGTVWTIDGTLAPKGRSKYLIFRQKLLYDLYQFDNHIALRIAYELPDVYVGVVTFSTAFEGFYGTGEKIFNIFKKHACTYMDDGTAIHVTSLGDAGSTYGWAK